MTIDEALQLREGDYVCHRQAAVFVRGNPVRRPIRVTKVWVNERKTIVQIRLNSVGQDQWLDALEYDLPPAGLRYDRHATEWITPAEWTKRQAERKK